MSKLKYYVEMQSNDNDEIVDIYGYKDQVVAWVKGGVKTYHTDNVENKVNEIIEKLEVCGFRVINREVKEVNENSIF